MNKIRKTGIIAGIWLCALMLHILPAQAAKTQIAGLKAGATYACDLNGDGVKETIRFTRKVTGHTKNGYPKINYQIYINGNVMVNKTVSDSHAWSDSDEELEAYLLDVKSSDKYKEIFVGYNTFGGTYQVRLFRYTGKKLKQIAYKYDTNAPGCEYSRLMDTQSSNGTLTFHASIGTGNTSGMWAAYKYKISGGTLKLKSYVFTVDSSYSDAKYKVTKTLNATTSRTGSKKAFTLKKGSTVTVLKVYVGKKVSNTRYFYVKNTSGKKGWIKCSVNSGIKK